MPLTSLTSSLPSWVGRYRSYVPLWSKDAELQPRRRLKVCSAIAICFLVMVMGLVFIRSGAPTEEVVVELPPPPPPPEIVEPPRWTKPDGMTVVALVFYGRRQNVQILERYLRKNLVDNGGLLDRVHFVSKVRHPEDADFLEKIIDSNPFRYTFRDFGPEQRFGNYTGLWDQDIYPNTIYVKIDDDIVYIGDNTISDLVEYKVTHPEHLYISANIINHPRLQAVHNNIMTPRPFAPEFQPIYQTTDWRISTLPSSPIEEVPSMHDWPNPPFYKHRWLPMRGATSDDTPLRDGLNCSGLAQWQCSTLAHYSFFEHLENNNTHLYDFGVWDLHGQWYKRWSVNFFVAWGHEIIAARPFPEDDEKHLSVTYPQSIRKHCVAVGSAIASHLAYYWQQEMLNQTDVRDRYRAIVVDKVGSDILRYEDEMELDGDI